MSLLGSSPLGLIMDTENSSVKIGEYILNKADTDSGKKDYNSLFGKDKEDISTHQFSFEENDNSLYDITTEEVVRFCSDHPKMALTRADFAYLKNLGVYPNNRLIIARRFSAPMSDDLINNENPSYPLSTLISWVPDNEDFFSVDFGEEWANAPTSIAEILDEASKNRDIMGGDNSESKIGGFLAAGAGLIPLPGWTEGLQYQIFKELGLSDRDASDLPFGNPNLIRSARMRTVAPKDGQFEGVQTKISVKMIVEYEQKFISGIDPTGIYFDIIANALTFGTSDSKFMFRSDSLGTENNKFAIFLKNLASGDREQVKVALLDFCNAVGAALKAVGEEIAKVLTKAKEDAVNAIKKVKDISSATEAVLSPITIVANSLFGLLLNVISTVVSKYRIRIIGVLNALTGAPSTPWHITIGNPKRPIFSSGDMEAGVVKVTFGKILAFNDLPSSVKIEITFNNARALGSQEIYRKLNCGKERSYKKVRFDIAESSIDLPKSMADSQLKDESEANSASNTTSSSTEGAPLENKDQSKSTSADNKNKPSSSADKDCASNYNSIIDEIAKVLGNRPAPSSANENSNSKISPDTYGPNGKPLLSEAKGGFFSQDNETVAVNAIRELMNNQLEPKRNAVTKCSSISSQLDTTLDKIYSGIENRSRIKVDYYDASGNKTLKKEIDCNF